MHCLFMMTIIHDKYFVTVNTINNKLRSKVKSGLITSETIDYSYGTFQKAPSHCKKSNL
jgi:hypothetical protein